MGFNQMGNASNERRNQAIMNLRNAFNAKQVITIQAASSLLGLTATTIKRYCVDGDIPLIDVTTKQPVVKLTNTNTPSWLR